MTPQEKIRWAAVKLDCEWQEKPIPPFPCSDLDEFEDEDSDGLHDAFSELREGEVETKIPCESSRHYESHSVAMQFPDKSWVGWTYWYGGGKHGEPEGIDWIPEAYDIDCVEEEKLVVVRKFSKSKKK